MFTHSDLHSTNIIISRGRLAGIGNWDCAGFYPEYWEYESDTPYKLINSDDWEKLIRDAFDGDYEVELRIEKLL